MTTRPTPHRVSVKFFAEPDPGRALDLKPFIGLFHSFIQEKTLPGLLIDVADYAHVPNGPGIMLVGHEVDYAIDSTGGRTGLLTVRKRCGGCALDVSLSDVVARALVAMLAIHDSGATTLHLSTEELEIQVCDRLAVPNTEQGFAEVRGDIEAALARVFGTDRYELARANADDTRRPLSFSVSASGAPDAVILAERLGVIPSDARQSRWDIEVEELAKLREDGSDFVLIDVREPHEVEICSLGGTLIPLGSLSERLGKLDKQAHIVVYCRSGGRGGKAVEAMRSSGFENVWNLSGGILAWADRIDSSVAKY